MSAESPPDHPVPRSNGDDDDDDDDSEEEEEEEDSEGDPDGDGDDEGTNTSMAEEEEDDDDDDDDEDGDDATMSADPAGMPTAESTDTTGDGTAGSGSVGGNNNNNTNGGQGVVYIKAVPNVDRLHGLREIGREAICWQLSSAKPGNGVEQIRDGSVETYWQSDGNAQPHWIQVSFGRRVAISHVCLYLDFSLDESYTPRRAQVQVGMTNQDLISAMHPPMTQVEFQEPTGWCIIPLSPPPDPLDDVDNNNSSSNIASSSSSSFSIKQGGVVRAHLIRISILSMHQNGRDTHVRQVQLFGPRMVHHPSPPTGTSSSSSQSSSAANHPPPLSAGARSSPSLQPMASSSTSSSWLSSSLQNPSFQTIPASQFSTIR